MTHTSRPHPFARRPNFVPFPPSVAITVDATRIPYIYMSLQLACLLDHLTKHAQNITSQPFLFGSAAASLRNIMPSPPSLTLASYTLHAPLGQGTAGQVFLATSQSKPSSRFAVKIIPPAKVRTAVRREVALHHTLHHPNIVHLHEVHTANPSSHLLANQNHFQAPSLALVMELAPAGDMFSEVAAAGTLPPRVLRRRLRDIVSALTYLHSQRIAHLDIKLENVVISNSNTAKLADFGCAARLGHNEPSPCVAGTLHYLPPELAQNSALPPATTSDAWSLGVLAYTAIAGAYPFNGARAGASDQSNDRATRYRILNSSPHPIPSFIDVPSDLTRIINGLLEKDPAKRMTIPQVAKELGMSLKASAALHSHSSSEKRSSNAYRPRSPTSPVDARFEKCHPDCSKRQTREDALRVVDVIRANRALAGAATRKHVSESNNKTSSSTRSKPSIVSKTPKRSTSGVLVM